MDASTLGRRLAFLAVACVAATGGATRIRGEASQVPQLLTTVAQPEAAAHAAERGVARARTVQVDLSLLSGDVEQIDLALFDDARYLVRRYSVERPGAGRLVWHGRIDGTDQAVSFAVTDGILVGTAFTPNGEYRLHPLEGGRYALEQFNQSGLPPEAPPVVPEPSSFERPSEVSRPTVDDGSVIDVLVVYTPVARAAAGGTTAMQALIDLSVSFTNMSYQNSGVIQRVRLVHRAEVAYTQDPSNMLVDLNRLRATNDGFMDNIHALRDSYGADFVSLIGVETGNTCGMGFMMDANSISTAFASNAFNVTAWDCAAHGLSFAHELGHGMGLNHDTANTGGLTGAYSYAHGYRLAGMFRTVMSYDCTLQGLGHCPRVMHFSTPNRTHTVQLFGTFVTGVAGASDNAQALNNTRTVTANFRSSIPSPGCDTGSYTLSRTFTNSGSGDPHTDVGVMAPLGCPWTARTNDTFYTVNPSTGHGNGTVRITFTPNTTGTARIGAAVIAGHLFTVVQAPAAFCMWTSSFDASAVTYLPNEKTVTVTTQNGCPWSVVSNSPFITVRNGTGRAGVGTATIDIALNTEPGTRQGFVSVLNFFGGVVATYDFQQLAPPACTSTSYAINPATIGIGNQGTTGNITITTQPWCHWSATSNSSFISFSNASGRVGTGTIPVHITTNGARATRQGTATIAGKTFTVNQEMAPLLRLAPDVNNDGTYDLVWQNRFGGGYLAAWMMNGLTVADSALFNPSTISDPNWRVAATADMDGDGKLDLVFQEETQGWIGLWKMNGLNLVSSVAFSIQRVPDTNWKIVAAQDFNNDGKADLVWHDRALGYVALWYMNGLNVVSSDLFSPGRVADTNWQPEAAADFNADGKPDLLWRHQTEGWVTLWLLDGITRTAGRDLSPSRVSDTNWRIAAVGDVNRDNMPDLIWHDIANGWIGVWLMNGHALASSIAFATERVPDVNWRIVGPK